MINAFNKIYEIQKKHKTDMRMATYILAISRVTKSINKKK